MPQKTPETIEARIQRLKSIMTALEALSPEVREFLRGALEVAGAHVEGERGREYLLMWAALERSLKR